MLDVRGGVDKVGSLVRLWTNIGPGFAQRFEVTECGQLHWVSTTKCMSPKTYGATGITPGAMVAMEECDCLKLNQRFTMQDAPSSGTLPTRRIIASVKENEEMCLSSFANSNELKFVKCAGAAGDDIHQVTIDIVFPEFNGGDYII